MVTELEKKEELVIAWLKSHGYYHIDSTSNKKGILVDGTMRKMMVVVQDFDEKYYDETMIKALANENHREPWIALVESDGDIVWKAIE